MFYYASLPNKFTFLFFMFTFASAARSKTKGFITLLIVASVLTSFLIVGDLFIPYRPTPQDAVNHALGVIQPGKPVQLSGPSMSINRNVEIHQILPLGTTTQLVLLTYETVNTQTTGDLVASCIEVRSTSQRLVTGVFSYATSARCEYVLPASALELVSSIQEGNYILGGVVDDPDITSVQITWFDKTETVVSVAEKRFLLIQPNQVGLLHAVGLDAQGRIVPNSLTYDPAVNFSPLDYTTTQQMSFDDGVIVIGVYSQTNPYMLDCIEMLFLTPENARKYLSGESVFTSQRACLNPIGQVLGNTVSTQVSGETVIAGRVLSELITNVFIHWSDGTSQQVPVKDGLYFAHRGGTLAIDSVEGFDASGNKVSQP